MTDHDELVKLSKDQTEQLLLAINKVAKSTDQLSHLASSASSDARDAAHVIAPKAQSLLNLSKVFMWVVSGACTVLLAFATLWLRANFVSIEKYDSAWERQLGINQNALEQFKNFEVATRQKDVVDHEQERRITEMESDVKELRRLLKK